MADFPGLVFRELDGKLLARCQPVSGRAPLDNEALRAALRQAGFDGWFLHEGALATLVGRCNGGAAEFEMPVGERRDGSFTLEIPKDAASASVTLTPAQGGKLILAEEILAALAQAGVRFGVDEEAIRQACAANVPARLQAATGQPALHGEDAKFELLIDLARTRTPKVNEQGLIDFRELGDIPMVEAGVPLMRRVPASPGTDGRDVLEHILKATPGSDQPYDATLEGAAVSATDPNLLLSTVKGQPVALGNGVSVEQVYTVTSVSLASGNINFDGTVKVEGDILSGMKVKASGDIIVMGTVEGGELDAGGMVQISSGIIAHAKVRAATSVSARFVENSQIRAGTIIAIEDMVMQSDLQALNQILVGLKSPQRGRLVGGSARAMMLISTPLLGAANSTVTEIHVGVNPELEARLHTLEEQVAKLSAEQDNLKKVVTHLVQQGGKPELLARAKASWQQLTKNWAQALKEKDEVEKQLALIEGARIELTLGVAGAVDLFIGKQTRHLRSTFDAGAFSLDEGGRIVFTEPGGKPIVQT